MHAYRGLQQYNNLKIINLFDYCLFYMQQTSFTYIFMWGQKTGL